MADMTDDLRHHSDDLSHKAAQKALAQALVSGVKPESTAAGASTDPALEALGLLPDPALEQTAPACHEEEHQQLKPGDLCPQCGGVLVLRSTERGEFLGCSNYPDCSFVRHLPAAPVTNLAILSSTCPDCGRPLAVKHGRYGLFIGCSAYPECRYIVEKKVQSPIVCPMCRKGRIVKRQSRSGRSFYACNNYPACDFLLPGEPVESKCPDCGFPLRYKKKVKAGIALYCPNSLCPSKRKRKKELWQPD